MICIYSSNATKNEVLYTNGLAVLNNCINAYIEESINGAYNLTITYPLSDDKSKYIVKDKIIKAPGVKGDQVFRIVKTRRDTRQIECICKHISYDLDKNFIEDARPTNLSGSAALGWITSRLQYETEFIFNSNITNLNTAYYIRKNFLDAVMGNDDNSFLKRWGGELERDNYNFKILSSLGKDRGFRVEYGKNITAIEETVEGTEITRIMPTARDENDNVIKLPEVYIDSPLINNYPFPSIKHIDFPNIKLSRDGAETEYKSKEDIYEELRKQVKAMYEIDNVDRPQINFNIDFIALDKANEYKNINVLQQLYIGDLSTIKSNKLNLDIKARLRKYRWNCIRKKYISFELGDYIKSEYTANSIIKNTIEKVKNESYEIGNKLKEALGGHVAKREGEILIMDTEDISTATKVWRFNLNGLGYSRGYNGNYDIAITMDGEIVADFIKTGTLDADLIKTGAIKSKNGKVYLSIIDDFIQVSHTETSTRTRLDAEGFYILDEKGETIASLAAKRSWTELKADKVFANNIENIYEGPANLYVNHNSNNIVRDGSIEYPFTSFLELNNYLNSTPIIKKDIIINVVTSGVIGDRIFLEGLKGTGFITINFNKSLIVKNSGIAIEINNTSNSIKLNGNRSRYDSNDGCLFDTPVGFKIENCQRIFAGWFRCKNTEHGAKIYCSNVQLWQNDMCNANCGVEASYNSKVNCIDLCGDNNVAYRAVYGSVIHFGETNSGSWRPRGTLDAISGSIFGLGNVSLTGSFHTAPPIPPTIDQYREFSFSDYGYWSDMYGNWNPNGKTVYQGDWGYGNNRGIFTFNNSDISSFLSNATVLDGSTITLQRENAGGYSQAQTIYLCGTTHTSPGGSAPPVTKSYGSIGSLSWGSRGTFNLPKSFVQDLKSGLIKSVLFYTSDGSNYIKFSAVCALRLKVNK